LNRQGFTIPQLTAKDGARWSTYSAFLKNSHYDQPNLKVVTFAQVEKILIDESKQAYGVQYKRHGNLKTVLATKEIILSAGAIGSPQILMLSGIGPKEDLQRLEVMLHFLFFNQCYC
jgi:choline dehydrogenase-like flavoprotein